jgi:hypothetical protein
VYLVNAGRKLPLVDVAPATPGAPEKEGDRSDRLSLQSVDFIGELTNPDPGRAALGAGL